MADATTPNYGWSYPTVGADATSWGDTVNATIIAIDAQVKAVADVADAAVPAAGGTMSGALINSSGFEGPLTGNVTGNVSGSSGSCTGNAATATTAGSATTASSATTATTAGTANAVAAGAVTPAGLSTGHPTWDSSGDVAVGANLNVSTSIAFGSSVGVSSGVADFYFDQGGATHFRYDRSTSKVTYYQGGRALFSVDSLGNAVFAGGVTPDGVP